MLIRWKHIFGLAAAGVAAAFIVAWSGVVGIGASSGHWKVTDWFLHWAMRSSVRTAALGKDVPPFTDGMLPAAAGHFETGCAICHGSPADPPPQSVSGMLPVPPNLKPVIPTWTDAELFQIVQHGVRFTGMPAWPVQEREDEVWAMVAFLRAYPELDAAAYRRLAGQTRQQEERFAQLVGQCNGCHAPDRLSADGIVPGLGGQKVNYLNQALEAYATGSRPSGIMKVALEKTSADERRQLAEHFASQPMSRIVGQANADHLALGKVLAEKGDASKGVPACLACHDSDRTNSTYPRLSGQPPAYLAAQLRLFVEEKHGGGPYGHIMTQASAKLEAEEIEALSAYFVSRMDAVE